MNRQKYMSLPFVKPFSQQLDENPRVVDSYIIIDPPTENERYLAALSACAKKKRLRTCLRWLFALGVLIFLISLVAEYLLSPTTIVITTMAVGREGDVTLLEKPSKVAQPQSVAWQLTFTETSAPVSVQATGTFHHGGTQAKGTLTWFNQTQQTQTIPAGTMVSAGRTIQVITDADVVIPASISPGTTQAIGPAHVKQVGTQGNIVPGTVDDTLCSCAPGVSVTNLAAFSGGSDEQTGSILLQGDVDRAVANQKDPLTQRGLDTFQRQVQPPEHVAATPVCSSSTSANHPIGSVVEPGTQIEASITIICRAVVFDQRKVSNEATQRFILQVGHDLGKQFLPSQMTVKVEQSILLDSQGTLQLSLHIQGTWVYRLSDEQRHTLQKQLAGATPGQAEQILTHVQGLRQEKILPACGWICAWLPLPRNPEKIQITQET